MRSLDRGLEVLLAIQRDDKVSLRDLHDRTGIAKATLLRILAALRRHGFIWRGLEDGCYRPTRRYALSQDYSRVVGEAAAPKLAELCRDVGWASDIAVYENGKLTIAETTRGISPYPINKGMTGQSVHVLQSGLGKAYLAFCSGRDQKRVIEDLKDSADPMDVAAKHASALQAIIEATDIRGYGHRDLGYWARGRALRFDLNALALPVRGRRGTYAAINLVYPASAFTEGEFAERYQARLQLAADRIARDLDGLGVDPN